MRDTTYRQYNAFLQTAKLPIPRGSPVKPDETSKVGAE
jgi:hypothetical protein